MLFVILLYITSIPLVIRLSALLVVVDGRATQFMLVTSRRRKQIHGICVRVMSFLSVDVVHRVKDHTFVILHGVSVNDIDAI